MLEGFKPTYFTGASNRTFASSGQKIHVSAIVIGNTADGAETEVTFTDGDGTTVMIVAVLPDDTKVISGAGAPLLFPNGLIAVSTASTTHITVFQR